MNQVTDDPAAQSRAPAETMSAPRRGHPRAEPNPNALAFSLADVARLGGPKRTRCYAMIADGRLEAIRVGRSVRIKGDSLRKMLGVG